MATNAFTSIFGKGPQALTRDDLREYVTGSVGIYYHPACSCRMGPSGDPTAVVDPKGRVHGLDNLFVCDASIFPVIMRANTNLPAVMVAEHLAATIGTP
jgi:choline dehydrogenase-like flavoprotein